MNRESVFERKQAGTLVLCTKDVGDVCVEPGRDGPVVSSQRSLGL